jgi:hypothetical protein
MKEEIEAAALFITQLVSQSSQLANLSEERLQTFKRHLVRLFEERFHVRYDVLCFAISKSYSVSLLFGKFRITGFLKDLSVVKPFVASG